MMKKIFGVIVLLALGVQPAWAKKTVYLATDHRFNFVKIQEISIRDAEARAMSHPTDVDEEKIRRALSSLRLSQRHLISKEVDTQTIFNDDAVAFLAPALVRGFHEAAATDEIVFSYLNSDARFVLRNNRLTIASAWLHGSELHLKMKKLYAMVTGDIDKRGNEDRAASRAKGLRVAFDLQPGQTLATDDAEEVIIDLDHQGEAAVSQESPPTSATEAKQETKQERKKEAKKEVKSVTTLPTVKERLTELEELKKENLISKKEYEEKRKEILKDL